MTTTPRCLRASQLSYVAPCGLLLLRTPRSRDDQVSSALPALQDTDCCVTSLLLPINCCRQVDKVTSRSEGQRSEVRGATKRFKMWCLVSHDGSIAVAPAFSSLKQLTGCTAVPKQNEPKTDSRKGATGQGGKGARVQRVQG